MGYKSSATQRHCDLVREYLNKTHERFIVILIHPLQNTFLLRTCITSFCSTKCNACQHIRTIECPAQGSSILPICSGRNSTPFFLNASRPDFVPLIEHLACNSTLPFVTLPWLFSEPFSQIRWPQLSALLEQGLTAGSFLLSTSQP